MKPAVVAFQPVQGAVGGVYLSAFLEPFAAWLARADVTDILVNKPGEVWVESVLGTIERFDAPAVTTTNLTRLAAQIARISKQGISREHPLLSASLPTGERIQIILPPATRGHVALAIRKHVLTDLTLGDYVNTGAMAHTVGAGAIRRQRTRIVCYAIYSLEAMLLVSCNSRFSSAAILWCRVAQAQARRLL